MAYHRFFRLFEIGLTAAVLTTALPLLGYEDLISQEGNAGQVVVPPQPTESMEGDSRLQIGANYTYVHLKPHGLEPFNGNLGGMQLFYEYRPLNEFYGGVKFAWKEGKTHGTNAHRSLLYFDVQERVGYTLAVDNADWLFTFFSGMGYRHIGQKLTTSTSSPLRFNYNELYVPVGVLADYAINSWMSCGLNLTWMPQVYPTVSIIPLKGTRWILTNTLTNCYIEVPLTFSVTQDKRFFIIFNPFYERWEDGHSTAKLSDGTALGLPGNTYQFCGADVNFAYSF